MGKFLNYISTPSYYFWVIGLILLGSFRAIFMFRDYPVESIGIIIDSVLASLVFVTLVYFIGYKLQKKKEKEK